VLRSIRAHWRAHVTAGRPRNERVFASAGTVRPLAARVVTRYMRELMALSPVRGPLGAKWTGHLIRAGAASMTHAIVSTPTWAKNVAPSVVDRGGWWQRCSRAPCHGWRKLVDELDRKTHNSSVRAMQLCTACSDFNELMICCKAHLCLGSSEVSNPAGK